MQHGVYFPGAKGLSPGLERRWERRQKDGDRACSLSTSVPSPQRGGPSRCSAGALVARGAVSLERKRQKTPRDDELDSP